MNYVNNGIKIVLVAMVFGLIPVVYAQQIYEYKKQPAKTIQKQLPKSSVMGIVQEKKPVIQTTAQKQPLPKVSGQKQTTGQVLVGKTPVIQASGVTSATQVQVPTEKKAEKKFKLIVRNTISDKSLAYKYGFFHYSPRIFEVKVNGQKIEQGKALTLEIPTSRFTVSYFAEFPNKRQSKRVIEYELLTTGQEVSIDFSWKNEDRLKVSGAKQVRVIEQS